MSKNYVNSFWRRNTEELHENIPYFSEDEKEIWNMVQKMPEKYRIVIKLHYWEGYTIRFNELKMNEDVLIYGQDTFGVDLISVISD